jgi:hypothetical protein
MFLGLNGWPSALGTSWFTSTAPVLVLTIISRGGRPFTTNITLSKPMGWHVWTSVWLGPVLLSQS